MSTVKRILRGLDEKLESWMIVFFYAYFIIIVVLEVTLRYGFNESTIVGEETARHAFIWLSWVAASAAVKKRMHIKITYLEYKVSEKNKYYLNFFYNALLLFFCLIAIRYVIPIIQTQIEFGTLSRAAQYPMWIIYMAIPFGYGMMIVRVIQNMVIDVKNFRAGRPISSGEALI